MFTVLLYKNVFNNITMRRKMRLYLYLNVAVTVSVLLIIFYFYSIKQLNEKSTNSEVPVVVKPSVYYKK